MNPRISFDGLNWRISVCVEFPDCKETLNDDGVGIDLGIKDLEWRKRFNAQIGIYFYLDTQTVDTKTPI